MFRSARIKLTSWYLLIIMVISITFSIAMYRVLITEVDRFDRMQRSEIERKLENWGYPFFTPKLSCSQTPVSDRDLELVKETKQRIILSLGIINAAILLISGYLSYILAGRTLTPIKQMVDEQNRFISDASHELRTPLTSLKSAFEVFLRSRRPTIPEAKDLVTESLDEVGKLQSLSDSLLQLAQYQTNNGQTAFEVVSLSQIVAEAIRKTEHLAIQKNIRLDAHLDPFEISGNKYSLIDLFIILLDNAIKYSPSQTHIIIRLQRQDGWASVTVQDQGIGISQSDLPHVFKRFYRADTTRTKNASSGYGLGLSIAKRITEIHNGSIAVQSQSGHGSTFTVRLPISQSTRLRKPQIFS